MLRHRKVALVGVLSFLSLGAGPRAVPAPQRGIQVVPRLERVELEYCDTVEETVTVVVPAQWAPRSVDIYLLADTTGSMEPVLAAVQEGATDLVDRLKERFPTASLRFGVGTYRDFPGEEYAFAHQLAPTADRDAVVDAIDDWVATGGGDAPEGQLYALDRLAHGVDADGGPIGWRHRSERIVVWFGDAPGHDPICSEISGLPETIDENSVTDALVDAGIQVVAISTTTGYPLGLDDNPSRSTWKYSDHCDIREGSPGQATRITDATEGAYVEGVDESDIVDTIVDRVIAQVRTIGRLEIVPGALLAPFVAGFSDPVGPLDPWSRHEIAFDVTYTGDVPCAAQDRVVRGTIDILADGGRVGVQHVFVTVPACSP